MRKQYKICVFAVSIVLLAAVLIIILSAYEGTTGGNLPNTRAKSGVQKGPPDQPKDQSHVLAADRKANEEPTASVFSSPVGKDDKDSKNVPKEGDFVGPPDAEKPPNTGYTPTEVSDTNLNPDAVRERLGNCQKAFTEFNARYGNKWKLKCDSQEGSLRSVYGFKTPPRAGEPVEVAKSFLSEIEALLGIRVSDFSEPGVDKRINQVQETIITITFSQTYEGIHVEDGWVHVYMTGEGEVLGMDSNCQSDLQINATVPAFEEGQVAKVVIDDLKITDSKTEITPKLVVFRRSLSQPARLTWKVVLPQEYLNENNDIGTYYIDADTGKILLKRRHAVVRSQDSPAGDKQK